MNQSLFNRMGSVVLAFSALLLWAGRTSATEISGTISTTRTIMDDSELVGDVTCMVADAPCIALRAPGIKLRLNGFTITGRADPPNGCTPTATFPSEDGIDVVAQHDVAILGPGLIQKFASVGIFLKGASKVKVKGVTLSDNCFSGILLTGTADSDIEKNVSVRNSIGSQGFACGGTWLASSHNNRVRLNTYSGNGSPLSITRGASNNFGVGLVGTSKDNFVERNKIGGNLNGVYISFTTLGGNVIRHNIIAGNPPAQVSAAFGASIGADIRDLSDPVMGANTFEDNQCLTYMGSVEPAPCPSISRSDNDEDQQDRDTAAFSRKRLTFPQARLVNAVFHLSERLPKAVGSTSPGQTASSDSVTVTGKVVDAACFMMHAPAATAASHKDCGAACLARGVPLAIATDNGILYFPADGNERLKSLLNARVRASGTVVEKHDPMELKMPVGEKNQMVVRVEGGYKQITIQTLEKIPAANRRPT